MRDSISMTAIILAGGKSSRMGKDKALLKFGEKTMLENLVDFTSGIFSETLVIVNETMKIESLNLRETNVYIDLIKNQGPLGGIYTGLVYSRNVANFVFTCDMPFINECIIDKLVEFCEVDFDVICFEEPEGNYEPFPGIYSRGSRSLIKSLLDVGNNSMKRFFEIATVKPVRLEKEKIKVLTNMNYWEDYDRALKEKEEWSV